MAAEPKAESELNVPAIRLLVAADPKMLTALANAMRAGARFEVTTAALAEPAALAPLAANADVVALFYGSKQSPLPEAVRALAPELRARGGRLIAVLQKEQAGVRDDCFRAGARPR